MPSVTHMRAHGFIYSQVCPGTCVHSLTARSARGLSRSLAASRENSLAGSGDSDGNVTDDFGGTQQEGGGATVGSGAGAGAQHRLSSMASAAATMAEGGAEAEGAGEAGMSVCMAPDGAQYESLEGAQAGGRHGDAAHSNTTSPNASQRAGGGPARSCSHVGGEGGGTGHENESVAVMHNGLLQNGGGAAASAAEEAVGASQQQQQQQQTTHDSCKRFHSLLCWHYLVAAQAHTHTRANALQANGMHACSGHPPLSVRSGSCLLRTCSCCMSIFWQAQNSRCEVILAPKPGGKCA
eukprot:647697-Pelagomonas_calceolata.AAC.6